MFNSIENLVSVGWSMLIFLSAYLANVTFSLVVQHQTSSRAIRPRKVDQQRLQDRDLRDRPDPVVCGLDHTSLVCERSRLGDPPGVPTFSLTW